MIVVVVVFCFPDTRVGGGGQSKGAQHRTLPQKTETAISVVSAHNDNAWWLITMATTLWKPQECADAFAWAAGSCSDPGNLWPDVKLKILVLEKTGLYKEVLGLFIYKAPRMVRREVVVMVCGPGRAC